MLMMNLEKKVVYLSGTVQPPLKIGASAFIFHNGRIIRTSVVMAIHQVSKGLIVFETQNSTYCVAPQHSPVSAAVVSAMPLCA
jgi:hypothetical protein